MKINVFFVKFSLVMGLSLKWFLCLCKCLTTNYLRINFYEKSMTKIFENEEVFEKNRFQLFSLPTPGEIFEKNRFQLFSLSIPA